MSFTIEGRLHRALPSRRLAVAATTATLVIGVTAMTANNTTADAASAAQSCDAGYGTFTVSGTATRQDDGSTLNRFGVFVTRHGVGRVLAKGRTTKTGSFSLTACWSATLAKYSSLHHGAVDFDVMLHAWDTAKGYLWVQTFPVAYGVGSFPASAAYTPVSLVQADSSRMSGAQRASVTPGAQTLQEDIYPPIMFAEVVPKVKAAYSVSSSSIGTVEARVGGGDGIFKASGSMTIDSRHEFGQTGVLEPSLKQMVKAIYVEPQLSAESNYSCVPTGAWGWGTVVTGGSLQCMSSGSGHWTGKIRREETPYVACTSGSAPILVINNRDTKSISIGEGTTYTGRAAVDTIFGGVTVTSRYGGDTQLGYNFVDTDTKKKFCIGGNGADVASSSALLVSQIRTGGTGCISTEASPTCRLNPWEVRLK